MQTPLVDGHVFVCHPTLLQQLFGHESRIFLQHANNDVAPSFVYSNVKTLTLTTRYASM